MLPIWGALPIGGKLMHGGMDVPDEPRQQLLKQAEDCLDRAMETADSEYQRLWHTLALDCLRFASTIREFKNKK
jgi:hypothetical protein